MLSPSGRTSGPSLKIWHESVLVGMGINWFLEDAQQYANIAKWAYVGTGHNMVVDTLVKSGLLGLAALVPLLVGAVLATRALKITAAQIACFGFLAAFSWRPPLRRSGRCCPTCSSSRSAA